MDERISSFESLFHEHADAIYRFLLYKLSDPERALEMTQEVFMRTWQHLAAGKNIDSKRAFLYRVARNLFINEIRTDRTTRSLETMAEEQNFQVEDTADSPLRVSEQQELLRLLEQLPEDDRELIILRYIEDWAVKDIAALLDERENTISMRITRALERLRSMHRPTTT